MISRHSLVLSLLLASVSAIDPVRRFLQNNAPFLGSSMNFGGDADIDMSCELAMALTEDSCIAQVDSKGTTCVWCSLGGELGSCISSDIAATINEAGIPHLQCGVQLTQEDETFFEDLKSCVVKGDTAAACHDPSVTSDGTGCTWCVTEQEPLFGSCFSNAFVSEIQGLDTTGLMSMFVDCSADASQDVGAITDMNCITNGSPEDTTDTEVLNEMCLQAKDALGLPCVSTSLYGMMDVCLTETQKSLFDFSQTQMDMMGISPMSLMGGGMPSGGDELEVAKTVNVEEETEEEAGVDGKR